MIDELTEKHIYATEWLIANQQSFMTH